MTKLKLSLACTQTDRSAPIFDGRVAVEGCEIIALPGDTQDIFRRVLNDEAFDIAEMSMSTQIVQAARGGGAYVAIPVFLSRTFRHSAITIRTDRGITRPEDLKGRTVGIEQYQQTVGLWVRGILNDEYGVATRDVHWRSGGLEQPGGGERLAVTLPADIDLKPVPTGETLNKLLVAGELDATVTSRAPSCLAKREPNIGRLFPDYVAAEQEYFTRTRCFPIMHCVVIRRALVEQYPWLPVEVFRAFARAKALSLRDLAMLNIPRVSLAWIAEQVAEAKRVLGDNPWPYGIEESRRELEAMLRYSLADGLIDKALKPEDLFEPSTHGLRDAA
jgi:4,5-dihydroxyphthalate decarboxylase